MPVRARPARARPREQPDEHEDPQVAGRADDVREARTGVGRPAEGERRDQRDRGQRRRRDDERPAERSGRSAPGQNHADDHRPDGRGTEPGRDAAVGAVAERGGDDRDAHADGRSLAPGGVGDRCWDFHYLLTTMNRPTHWQARLSVAIVAALVAASAVPASPALAAATAPTSTCSRSRASADRQRLDRSRGRPRPGADGAAAGRRRRGGPPASPLASGIAMIGSAPAPLLIGLAAVLALAAAAVAGRRTGTGPRR